MKQELTFFLFIWCCCSPNRKKQCNATKTQQWTQQFTKNIAHNALAIKMNDWLLCLLFGWNSTGTMQLPRKNQIQNKNHGRWCLLQRNEKKLVSCFVSCFCWLCVCELFVRDGFWTLGVWACVSASLKFSYTLYPKVYFDTSYIPTKFHCPSLKYFLLLYKVYVTWYFSCPSYYFDMSHLPPI